LLPSGKFPRFAVAAAFLFALLLVLDLELVHSGARSLLVANSLDFAMVFLASVCAFYAARRSSGYARQLWILVAIAFSLETIGQGVSTYYQSFVPGSAQSPWPSDVLFFVWAVPIFMIFLPRSDEDPSGIDAIRLLDFLQVAILAVTLYLYFFYSPARWQTSQPAILRQILLVYISRDVLLSLAFFFRARSAIPAWFRTFCLVLSMAFLGMVLANSEYLLAIINPHIPSGWGDLIWMVPSILLISFAVKWVQPNEAGLSPSASRMSKIFNAQVLAIVIPLLVIFMGRAISREHTLLAWVIVAASVICSSFRLILSNRRQKRIDENLLRIERDLRSSEEILSTAFRNSPDAFSINPFPNGPYLEVNDGYTKLTGFTREEALGKTPREMNLWVGTERRDEALAALRASGHLRDFEFRFRTKSGQIRIGQMSASIIEIRGQRCSLVIVRDITERKEAEEILRSSEERFRSLVRDLYFAVVIHTPDARVEFANRAAHRMFHLPEGAAIGKRLLDLGIYAVSEDGKPLPVDEQPIATVVRTRMPLQEKVMAIRHPSSKDPLWIFGNAVPLYDANSNLVRVISSFADVTEMKNAERAIHTLSTQLLKLQDEERRRLGRELHDGLAQTVLAINLSLAQVRQSLSSKEEAAAVSLEKARELTQQMSREIRTLSYLLHPPLLDDLGLVSTLKEYVQGFSERSGIDTQLIAPANLDRLPQPLEISLFRIVQESLANIQRHSGSRTAEIHLSQEDSCLTLEVIDFGRGFRQSTSAPMPSTPDGGPGTASASSNGDTDSEASSLEGRSPHRLGVGIPGMRERMAQLGGQLEIVSGPNGTTVRATITVPQAALTETVDDRSSHLDRG